MQKLLTFFSAKILSVYAIFNDQSFKDTLTNNIVSFEQLGPGHCNVLPYTYLDMKGVQFFFVISL